MRPSSVLLMNALLRRGIATYPASLATAAHATAARRYNSSSDYTPVDGALFAEERAAQQQQQQQGNGAMSDAQSERMRKRRMAMFSEISGAFGGGPGGSGLEATGLPPGMAPEAGANKMRFSASDEPAAAAASSSSSSSHPSAAGRGSGGEERHSISGWQSTPLVAMEESPIPGVYIIRINNPPVNTCTLEVLRGMLYCLTKLASTFENDVADAAKPNPWDPKGTAMLNRCRGVILHSSVANIFSAGMDLEQLLTVGADAAAERAAAGNGDATPPPTRREAASIPYDPTTHNADGTRIPYASFVQYWGTLQHFHFTLLGYPVPVVAAISGDAPAGGCLMGMLSDYRVMAAKASSSSSSDASKPPRLYKIGMTSVRAGFAVPPWIASMLRYTVGPRLAEEMLTQSRMVTAEEAKERFGLIDQISESDETVLLDALAAMEFLLANIPFQHTFWHVKETCRRPLLDMLETREKRLDDVSNYISHLSNSTVYGSMVAYKDALGSGKKKGGNSNSN